MPNIGKILLGRQARVSNPNMQGKVEGGFQRSEWRNENAITSSTLDLKYLFAPWLDNAFHWNLNKSQSRKWKLWQKDCFMTTQESSLGEDIPSDIIHPPTQPLRGRTSIFNLQQWLNIEVLPLRGWVGWWIFGPSSPKLDSCVVMKQIFCLSFHVPLCPLFRFQWKALSNHDAKRYLRSRVDAWWHFHSSFMISRNLLLLFPTC